MSKQNITTYQKKNILDNVRIDSIQNVDGRRTNVNTYSYYSKGHKNGFTKNKTFATQGINYTNKNTNQYSYSSQNNTLYAPFSIKCINFKSHPCNLPPNIPYKPPIPPVFPITPIVTIPPPPPGIYELYYYFYFMSDVSFKYTTEYRFALLEYFKLYNQFPAYVNTYSLPAIKFLFFENMFDNEITSSYFNIKIPIILDTTSPTTIDPSNNKIINYYNIARIDTDISNSILEVKKAFIDVSNSISDISNINIDLSNSKCGLGLHNIRDSLDPSLTSLNSTLESIIGSKPLEVLSEDPERIGYVAVLNKSLSNGETGHPSEEINYGPYTNMVFGINYKDVPFKSYNPHYIVYWESQDILFDNFRSSKITWMNKIVELRTKLKDSISNQINKLDRGTITTIRDKLDISSNTEFPNKYLELNAEQYSKYPELSTHIPNILDNPIFDISQEFQQKLGVGISPYDMYTNDLIQTGNTSPRDWPIISASNGDISFNHYDLSYNSSFVTDIFGPEIIERLDLAYRSESNYGNLLSSNQYSYNIPTPPNASKMYYINIFTHNDDTQKYTSWDHFICNDIQTYYYIYEQKLNAFTDASNQLTDASNEVDACFNSLTDAINSYNDASNQYWDNVREWAYGDAYNYYTKAFRHDFLEAMLSVWYNGTFPEVGEISTTVTDPNDNIGTYAGYLPTKTTEGKWDELDNEMPNFSSDYGYPKDTYIRISLIKLINYFYNSQFGKDLTTQKNGNATQPKYFGWRKFLKDYKIFYSLQWPIINTTYIMQDTNVSPGIINTTWNYMNNNYTDIVPFMCGTTSYVTVRSSTLIFGEQNYNSNNNEESLDYFLLNKLQPYIYRQNKIAGLLGHPIEPFLLADAGVISNFWYDPSDCTSTYPPLMFPGPTEQIKDAAYNATPSFSRTAVTDPTNLDIISRWKPRLFHDTPYINMFFQINISYNGFSPEDITSNYDYTGWNGTDMNIVKTDTGLYGGDYGPYYGGPMSQIRKKVTTSLNAGYYAYTYGKLDAYYKPQWNDPSYNSPIIRTIAISTTKGFIYDNIDLLGSEYSYQKWGIIFNSAFEQSPLQPDQGFQVYMWNHTVPGFFDTQTGLGIRWKTDGMTSQVSQLTAKQDAGGFYPPPRGLFPLPSVESSFGNRDCSYCNGFNIPDLTNPTSLKAYDATANLKSMFLERASGRQNADWMWYQNGLFSGPDEEGQGWSGVWKFDYFAAGCLNTFLGFTTQRFLIMGIENLSSSDVFYQSTPDCDLFYDGSVSTDLKNGVQVITNGPINKFTMNGNTYDITGANTEIAKLSGAGEGSAADQYNWGMYSPGNYWQATIVDKLQLDSRFDNAKVALGKTYWTIDLLYGKSEGSGAQYGYNATYHESFPPTVTNYNNYIIGKTLGQWIDALSQPKWNPYPAPAFNSKTSPGYTFWMDGLSFILQQNLMPALPWGGGAEGGVGTAPIIKAHIQAQLYTIDQLFFKFFSAAHEYLKTSPYVRLGDYDSPGGLEIEYPMMANKTNTSIPGMIDNIKLTNIYQHPFFANPMILQRAATETYHFTGPGFANISQSSLYVPDFPDNYNINYILPQDWLPAGAYSFFNASKKVAITNNGGTKCSLSKETDLLSEPLYTYLAGLEPDALASKYIPIWNYSRKPSELSYLYNNLANVTSYNPFNRYSWYDYFNGTSSHDNKLAANGPSAQIYANLLISEMGGGIVRHPYIYPTNNRLFKSDTNRWNEASGGLFKDDDRPKMTGFNYYPDGIYGTTNNCQAYLDSYVNSCYDKFYDLSGDLTFDLDSSRGKGYYKSGLGPGPASFNILYYLKKFADSNLLIDISNYIIDLSDASLNDIANNILIDASNNKSSWGDVTNGVGPYQSDLDSSFNTLVNNLLRTANASIPDKKSNEDASKNVSLWENNYKQAKQNYDNASNNYDAKLRDLTDASNILGTSIDHYKTYAEDASKNYQLLRQLEDISMNDIVGDISQNAVEVPNFIEHIIYYNTVTPRKTFIDNSDSVIKAIIAEYKYIARVADISSDDYIIYQPKIDDASKNIATSFIFFANDTFHTFWEHLMHQVHISEDVSNFLKYSLQYYPTTSSLDISFNISKKSYLT